jgi:hypothetical protein
VTFFTVVHRQLETSQVSRSSYIEHKLARQGTTGHNMPWSRGQQEKWCPFLHWCENARGRRSGMFSQKEGDLPFRQPAWPISCGVQVDMIGQAFSVYLRRIFGLPMEQYSYIVFIIKAF